MKLIDVLKTISGDLFPPTLEIKGNCIDTRPQSIYKVAICFMCEEETWITCNIQNEILIPWYDCEVHAFEPGEDYTLQIWLKHIGYVQEHWPQHLWEEVEDGDVD